MEWSESRCRVSESKMNHQVCRAWRDEVSVTGVCGDMTLVNEFGLGLVNENWALM